MDEAPKEDRAPFTRGLRVGLARTVLLAGLIGALLILGRSNAILGIPAALLAGLAYGATALIEQGARRRSSSLDHVLMAISAWGITALGLAAVPAQFAYTKAMAAGQGVALEAAAEQLPDRLAFLVAIALSSPLPFITYARLARWSFPELMALAILGSSGITWWLSGPLYRLELEHPGSEVELLGRGVYAGLWVGAVVVCALVWESACALADRLSIRTAAVRTDQEAT